jgi:succinyl-CoA synthetase beta subunit
MFLLEHDGKELLAARGIAVPAGLLVDDAGGFDAAALPPGPWMVKGQVASGGRGKAGGVRRAATEGDVARALGDLLGTKIKGHTIRACRVEQQVAAAGEAYLSFGIDGAAAAIRVLLSARGGVEIESLPAAAIRTGLAPADPAALAACVRDLSHDLPNPMAGALIQAGTALVPLFLDLEAMLLEINPPDSYPETALKWHEGFDYLELDPAGEIALLTTGAGLSMMLIDELVAAGLKPFNFLDIRTGGLRGDPARLIQVLEWAATGPNVAVVLVNIFAGITHLGELSRLLLQALDAVPQLTVPVVARLIGNGLDDARAALEQAGDRVVLETDLDRAVELASTHVRGADR